MCYSAQIWAAYAKFVRRWGASLDIEAFKREYWDSFERPLSRLPKAFTDAFGEPRTPAERDLAALIAQEKTAEAARLERVVFAQKRRFGAAERRLQLKTTRNALEEQRIARGKIEWALGKLADLRRTELQPRDARIYPGWYAPVMIMEGGRRVLKMMRYQCRPAGKPASHDSRYPGTYNARRDNLEGFWKGQFGHTHGIIVAERFYENVARHAAEGRALAPGEKEENVVLEFRPSTSEPMLVACLWSRWTDPRGELPDLHSFAAITDEPPAEVAAAGHDRCIVPIKPQHLDAWLSPEPDRLAACYAILDDRERPYYQHRMAA